ncbi:MAG: hypothetical protein Q4P65_04105 [Eubacteriales bacterium]|nr:hypothetical protein [Eubacteriales bacterium]
MHYISTRGGERKYSFTEAFLAQRAEDGGYFVANDLPELSWQELMMCGADSRAIMLFEAFAPEFSGPDVMQILLDAFNDEAYPMGLLKAGPVNKYLAREQIIELDRGPSGSLFDFEHSLHLALYKQLNLKRRLLIPPYPLRQLSFLAVRKCLGAGEEIPADFLINKNCPEQLAGVTEGDRFLKLGLRPPELELQLRQFNKSNIEIRELVDGSSPAAFLAYLIVLASGLAELAEGDANYEPQDFLIPTFDLQLLMAALYLKAIGAPLKRLLIVNAANHQLSDFIRTGKYSNRRRFSSSEVCEYEDLWPSNLEKLVFELCGRNHELTKQFFDDLANKRQGQLPREYVQAWKPQLAACYSNSKRAEQCQTSFYHETDFYLDPYTSLLLAAGQYFMRGGEESYIFPLIARPWLPKIKNINEMAREAGLNVQSYYQLEARLIKSRLQNFELVYGDPSQ